MVRQRGEGTGCIRRLFIRQCLGGENDRGDRMGIDTENLVMKESG